MKRYFNTTGFCRPDWHYMVDPLRGLQHSIYDLIDKYQYFIIHAPRQSGKTTLLHSLARQLNAEGKYICVVFSIENAGYRGIAVDDAMFSAIKSIYIMAKQMVKEEYLPPDYSMYKKDSSLLFQYLNDWCCSVDKSVVLFLDEIDSLYDEVLVSVLRQLRNGFQIL